MLLLLDNWWRKCADKIYFFNILFVKLAILVLHLFTIPYCEVSSCYYGLTFHFNVLYFSLSLIHKLCTVCAYNKGTYVARVHFIILLLLLLLVNFVFCQRVPLGKLFSLTFSNKSSGKYLYTGT